MSRRSDRVFELQRVPQTLYDQSGTRGTVKLRADFEATHKKRSPPNAPPGDTQPMPTIFEQDGYRFFFTATIIAPFMSTSVTVEVKQCSMSRNLLNFANRFA